MGRREQAALAVNPTGSFSGIITIRPILILCPALVATMHSSPVFLKKDSSALPRIINVVDWAEAMWEGEVEKEEDT